MPTFEPPNTYREKSKQELMLLLQDSDHPYLVLDPYRTVKFYSISCDHWHYSKFPVTIERDETKYGGTVGYDAHMKGQIISAIWFMQFGSEDKEDGEICARMMREIESVSCIV